MCEHAYFGAKTGVVRGKKIQGNVHEHAQNVGRAGGGGGWREM